MPWETLSSLASVSPASQMGQGSLPLQEGRPDKERPWWAGSPASGPPVGPVPLPRWSCACREVSEGASGEGGRRCSAEGAALPSSIAPGLARSHARGQPAGSHLEALFTPPPSFPGRKSPEGPSRGAPRPVRTASGWGSPSGVWGAGSVEELGRACGACVLECRLSRSSECPAVCPPRQPPLSPT